MEGKNSAPQAHAWLTLWHQYSKRWAKREAIKQSETLQRLGLYHLLL